MQYDKITYNFVYYNRHSVKRPKSTAEDPRRFVETTNPLRERAEKQEDPGS